MAKRKKIIITNNEEIYEKFNMLNFESKIILENVKAVQVNKIINNINSPSRILNSKIFDDYIEVERINPINFIIYLNS